MRPQLALKRQRGARARQAMAALMAAFNDMPCDDQVIATARNATLDSLFTCNCPFANGALRAKMRSRMSTQVGSFW